MKQKNKFELQAEACKVLTPSIRMEIIQLLMKREYCFTGILEITGGLKSNLSQHLKIITKKVILNFRRVGQCSHFSLSSIKVAQACELMCEVLVENLKEQQELFNKDMRCIS